MSQGNHSVILENIRSGENVGSIFRTADAAGFSKIYLAGFTPTPDHPKVNPFDKPLGRELGAERLRVDPEFDRRIKKASLGAENFLDWEKVKRTGDLIKRLKKQGYKIIALEQSKKSKSIFSLKEIPSKFAIILGNEVKGISLRTLKLADEVLEIPMFGKKESLNVAVAFGIAAYFLIKNNR